MYCARWTSRSAAEEPDEEPAVVEEAADEAVTQEPALVEEAADGESE
jgi:hypothetical protein